MKQTHVTDVQQHPLFPAGGERRQAEPVIPAPARKGPEITPDVPAWTKGETVATSVLNVLAGCTITGNTVFLPSGQLDRKLYEQVNVTLTRIGGKWNRKAKGHLFDEDPTDLFFLVLATGQMPPKNPTAFFPTPPALAARLLTDSAFYGIPDTARRILEPGAGTGNIARAIRDYCIAERIDATLDCCEIVPAYRANLEAQGFRVVADDFFSLTTQDTYDAIVMNPPFAVEGKPLAYIEHIAHAVSLLAYGGVLTAIVPAGFAFREDARTAHLRSIVEQCGSWESLESGSFQQSGTGVNTIVITLKK